MKKNNPVVPKGVNVSEFIRQKHENAKALLQAIKESPLRTKERVRYLDLPDGSKLYGDGPAFLFFPPDGSVWWHLIYAPHPDNRAIYKGLDALDGKGQPKAEVYKIATLPTEDHKIFRDRTLDLLQKFDEYLERGKVREARNLLPTLRVTTDYAVEANQVLQPIRELLRSHDTLFEKSLSEFVNIVRAARKFHIHQDQSGRNRTLTHEKFMDTVRELAKKLARVPFQSEIAIDTGESIQAVRQKLRAIGAAWVPAKPRGKDKGPRLLTR
jgi:hypothetical protein